jgi:predicted transposase YbfD/YdcC
MATSPFSIFTCFSSLRDPRRTGRVSHRLLDIVGVALCAVLAGANDWHQVVAFGHKRLDWLRRFFTLANGIPSHDTFERVFARLEPCALQRCLLAWLASLARQLGGRHIAVDGKTLRHSGSPANGIGALHLVSAWATQARISLAQVAVDSKSNEITAIPQLLELLDVKGAVVSIDAMGCQKEIARKITDGGGDYLLTVKENQDRLYTDILDSFVAAEEAGLQGVGHNHYEVTSTGHGRKESRSYTVLHNLEGIRDRKKWSKVKVIGRCFSVRTVGGKTSYETRYFIGSKKASARYYGKVLRTHWAIENGLHWQLDVVFREDDNRVRERNAAANLGLLRRVAVSLLKQHPGKGSIARKRYEAALDTEFLEEILKGGDSLDNL